MTDNIRERLDEPRKVMYDELAEEVGGATVEMLLEDAIQKQLTQLYDNKEQLKQQMQQG